MHSARESYTEHVVLRAEWTFAKQKWQRTPNKVRGDPELENAQILPGFKERSYE